MTNQFVIVVSGYARSGKSTLQRHLKNQGIPTASSSDILSVETLNFLNIPVTSETLLFLERKNEEAFAVLLKRFTPKNNPCHGMSVREAKIFVAEEVIVPEYSRKFFAQGCIDMLAGRSGVIFSTIKSEQDILLNLLDAKDIEYSLFNIIRDFTDNREDSRHLFPDGFNIINNGDIDDFLETFDSFTGCIRMED